MSTRLRALIVLGACAMLVTAFATAAASGSGSGAADEKIKVTLLTKATGGFWDAMIAGAKKYAKDHPNEIQLTTNACKTNDDTPCQIAEIQDAVTKGAKAIVVSPMGVGVTDALNKAQEGRRPDRLRRQHHPRCRPDCGRRDEQRQGRPGCRCLHQDPAEVRRHHRSARSRTWRAEPRPAHRRRQEGPQRHGRQGRDRGSANPVRHQDRRHGHAGPPHQVPGPHRGLLGV